MDVEDETECRKKLEKSCRRSCEMLRNYRVSQKETQESLKNVLQQQLHEVAPDLATLEEQVHRTVNAVLGQGSSSPSTLRAAPAHVEPLLSLR